MELDSLEISQISNSKFKKLSDKVIILYFVMLGGTINVGWNATMNSFDYFATKYPAYNITFLFPLAIYSAQMSSIFIIPKLSSAVSYHTRVIYCLTVNIMIILFLSLEADFFKETSFGISFIMLLLFWLGFNNNLCYASTAGFTNLIEAKYTAYLLIGLSLFGVIASSLKAVILWIVSSDSDDDLFPTLAYFVFIAVLLGWALFLHIIFIRSDFYRSRCFDSEERHSESLLTIDSSIPRRPERDFKTLYAVFKKVRFYLFLLFTLYIQMDLPFPGVMLKKPIPNIASHTKTVSMIITFTIFLVTGKKLAQYRRYYNKKIVIGIIFSRFIIVGLFIAQVLLADFPILGTTWFAYLNIALFGLTMGFCNVALFILGAEQVQNEKKEVSGFLSVFTLNIGALVGTASALIFKDIHPPSVA